MSHGREFSGAVVFDGEIRESVVPTEQLVTIEQVEAERPPVSIPDSVDGLIRLMSGLHRDSIRRSSLSDEQWSASVRDTFRCVAQLTDYLSTQKMRLQLFEGYDSKLHKKPHIPLHHVEKKGTRLEDLWVGPMHFSTLWKKVAANHRLEVVSLVDGSVVYTTNLKEADFRDTLDVGSTVAERARRRLETAKTLAWTALHPNS